MGLAPLRGARSSDSAYRWSSRGRGTTTGYHLPTLRVGRPRMSETSETSASSLAKFGAYELESRDPSQEADNSRPTFLARGFNPSGSLRHRNGRAFGPGHV